MNINHTGKTKKTDYIIIHKPEKNQDVGWKGFKEKVLKRYALDQAKNLLRNFEEFPTFQYKEKKFPLKIRLRTKFPILMNFLYAFLVFFKQLFYEGAIREGFLGLQVAIKTFIYNVYLGYLIYKEKHRK